MNIAYLHTDNVPAPPGIRTGVEALFPDIPLTVNDVCLADIGPGTLGRNPVLVAALAAYFQKNACDMLLFPDDAYSRAPAALLAAALHCSCLTSVTSVTKNGDAFLFARPICQANLTGTCTLRSFPVVLTVFVSEVPAKASGNPRTNPPVWTTTLLPLRSPGETEDPVISRMKKTHSDDLEHAVLVFCAGHGIRSPETTMLLRQAADSCSAGIAATRPVVTDGLLPSRCLTGISGSRLSAGHCVLFGVSGSQAFMEGVRGCGTIYSINTDPHAPVFSKSDFGTVCDLQDLLQALTASDSA